jgi:hypothetical protein
MPTVIAHHDVKDTEHWLASPKREEVQTHDAADAMPHDGVLPETLVFLVEQPAA